MSRWLRLVVTDDKLAFTVACVPYHTSYSRLDRQIWQIWGMHALLTLHFIEKFRKPSNCGEEPDLSRHPVFFKASSQNNNTKSPFNVTISSFLQFDNSPSQKIVFIHSIHILKVPWNMAWPVPGLSPLCIFKCLPTASNSPTMSDVRLLKHVETSGDRYWHASW